MTDTLRTDEASGSLLSNILQRLRKVARPDTGLGAALSGYVVFLVCLNLLICFWIGGNDYDSFAFHIARIVLERFGPLSETATTQIQQVFPTFFDYLHAPFLRLGYFLTLPTFVLFVAYLVSVCWQQGQRPRIMIILLLSSQAVVATISSFKNDFALALFAYFCWLAIYRVYNRHIYAPIVAFFLCALMGTKWHGLILAGPLGLCFLYELIRRRLFSVTALVLTAILLPVYIVVSSIPGYVENWMQFGSPFPSSTIHQYQPGMGTLARNLLYVFGFGIIDTFSIPLYFADYLSSGSVSRWVNWIFPGGKTQSFSILPSSIINVHGYVLPLVLVCCALVAADRSYDRSLRTSAFVALLYVLTVQYQSFYSDLFNRYMLSALILGLLPTAALLERVTIRKGVIYLAGIYMVVVSSHAMLMHHERPLIRLNLYIPTLGQSLQWPSIWPNILDRELLQFGMWSGYRAPFEVYRSKVRLSDSLTIVNTGDDVDVPFLYPFIAKREPANTRIINLKREANAVSTIRSAFVLTYKYVLNDPKYEEAYAYPGTGELRLYRYVHRP